METEAKKRLVFLGTILVPLLALSSAQGGDASRVPASDDVLSSEESSLEALWSLKDGQTVILGAADVRLDATVVIAASHIVIRGAPKLTRVSCPPGGSAFVVRGLNITLSNLNFGDCRNASVVRIGGRDMRSTDSSEAETIGLESDSRNGNKLERTVFIKNCLFQRNKASSGAAIRSSGYRLAIASVAFVDNEATQEGGAVHVSGGELEIEASAFENCGVKDGDGGAIRAVGVRTLSVSQSLFDGNFALYKKYVYDGNGKGGALSVEDCGDMTVKKSTFSNNRGHYYGGGVFVKESADVTIETSTFRNNYGDFGGGGVFVQDSADVIVEKSSFLYNRKAYIGGGFYVRYSGDVTVKESSFLNNGADDRGGGFCVQGCGDVTVEASTFSKNHADDSGGGFCVKESGDVTVKESTSETNSARNGGAIFVASVSLRIDDSSVVDNVAEQEGGGINVGDGKDLSLSNTTLRNNRAPFGGAIGLSAGSSMEACYGCKENLLQGNVAFRGGGVFCFACRMHWRYSMHFVENVAVESGGGIYAQEPFSSQISDAKLVGNVAAFGGGVALEDSAKIRLSGCILEKNVAIEGGGLHVSSENGHVESYEVWKSKFESNQALSLQQMENLSQNPTVFKWLRERKEILSIGQKEWVRRETYLQGRGGGLFLSLRNYDEGSSVEVSMWRSSVERNSAITGGGIYVDNDVLIKRELGDCQHNELSVRSCLEISYLVSRIVSNTASVAGGGMFVHVTDDRVSYDLPTWRFRFGNCDDEDAFYELCYDNNRILSLDGSGYGPRIAARAKSMEFLNVDSSLTGLRSGERLAVLKSSSRESSATAEDIQLILRDALGRRVSGETVDSELTFELQSNQILGKRVYRPVNGTITINETCVIGCDVSDTLVIKASDWRDLMASVKFSTLPCPGGELLTKSKTECFECPT